MKLKTITLYLLLANTVFSQNNLVINGSFEDLKKCPWGLSCYSDEFVNNIFNPTDGSPDLFSSCSISDDSMQPQNMVGYQRSRSGDNYVGIALLGDWYYDINTNVYSYDVCREYIGLNLKENLKENYVYYFFLYLSPAEKEFASRVYCQNVGVYFSVTQIMSATGIPACSAGSFGQELPYVPQIENTKAKKQINDTLNWTKIEGYYTAQGGEKHIIIGNFRTTQNSDTIQNPSAATFGSVSGFLNSYMFIDDVYLEELGPVGMVDEQGKIKTAYYNTSTNTLNVSERGNLIVYNMQGAKVLELSVISQQVVSVGAEDIGVAGVYVWQLQTEKSVQQGKFLVNE